jgi:hypothetical protein
VDACQIQNLTIGALGLGQQMYAYARAHAHTHISGKPAHPYQIIEGARKQHKISGHPTNQLPLLCDMKRQL